MRVLNAVFVRFWRRKITFIGNIRRKGLNCTVNTFFILFSGLLSFTLIFLIFTHLTTRPPTPNPSLGHSSSWNHKGQVIRKKLQGSFNDYNEDFVIEEEAAFDPKRRGVHFINQPKRSTKRPLLQPLPLMHSEDVRYYKEQNKVLKNEFKLSDDYQGPQNRAQNYVPEQRLVHLDMKGAPPKIEYLLKVLHMVSRLGATGILIEYEDMFPYEGDLQVVTARNHYSKEDVQTILDKCNELDLDVIPLVQTFGMI